jgi:tetratricopeptide (TPR) repeat protein
VDDEREYGFRHVLVREVAYNRLPRAGRIERHRSAAEWLGGLAATDELTERAAHHYVQALELSQALRRDVSGFAERARTVLARAGDHALELHAFAAAVRSYGWAAELWPRDDPQWPMLRFRQGKALVWAHERGRDELAEARDALLAAGERGLAAEAEILLGRLSFRLGHGDETLRHYRAAADLLSAVAPSPSKAMVLYAVARGLLVADQNSAALLVAREALSVAERVGADDVRAGALVVSGLAKVERGELEGLEEAEQGLELGERVNSTEVAVGLFNLADTLMELGRLDEAAVRRERAQRAAERLGDTRSLRWLAPELAGERYWAGEWDEALLLADRFVSTVEREGGHYQEAYARTIRGRIRLARGDAEGALADSERALVVGRAAGDPQALYPALAFRARVSSEAGDRRRCARLASELVALVDEAGAAPSAFLWAHDLALVLTVAGRGQRLVAVTEHVRKRTPWLEAARALASGDAAAAAALYEEIGALPEEASARMVWADQLARAGAPGEADAALARAKAFCARVGAREPNGLPRSGRNAPPTRQRREEQR